MALGYVRTIHSVLLGGRQLTRIISGPLTHLGQLCLFMCLIKNVCLLAEEAHLIQYSRNPSLNSSSISQEDARTCDRCSNGESLDTVILRQTSVDCVSGHWQAILRTDHLCDCELVCAHESGEACRSGHVPSAFDQKRSLCDSTLNLQCNEQTNRCQGPLGFTVSHIRHQSFYINWISNSSSTQNGTQIAIGKYTSSDVSQVRFTLIKTYITKNEANKFSAKLDNLQENTTYIVRVTETDGAEEFTIVKTNENTLVETLPKVLVTMRNSSSISIAFDDFKPPNYNLGYAIKFRAFITGNESWSVLSSNNTPFYMLNNLRPNSQYQVQILTWDRLHEQVRSHSEVVNVSTLDGCVYQNATFEVGQTVLSDCDQMCTCMSGGSLSCTQRCLQPFISITIAKSNNLECSPHLSDECCVRCASANNKASSADSKKFIDKPGDCPQEGRLMSNATCSSLAKTSECTHDYHCTGIKKCCPTACGHPSCQAPANSSATVVGCPFKCGQNAACVFSEEESTHKCACLSGFYSDEPIRGCAPMTNTQHQCTFEGQKYDIGHIFDHNCQTCVCSEALEVECKPKCEHHDSNMLPDNCRLVPDPHDPVCCQKRVCLPVPGQGSDHFHHHAHNETSLLRPSPGCKHLGEIYQVNESFYLDCELKCFCKANGEIECAPRCYADPGFDENFCSLIEDPDDPECCKISICDHNSTETLKSNLIIEMAESINSTSLKLRVLLNGSQVNQLNLTIFYSMVAPNETDREMSNRNWNSAKISSEDLVITSNKSVESILSHLQPETDYLIYVRDNSSSRNATSNTVFVRTYPPGINNTFKGCFHGSQIIQVGELFYEGDCEYKCVCREGGIRECEDRCPVFVDLIGYEHCHWEPSAEDPCCTLPICKNNFTDGPQCISNNGKQYLVGDTWSVGSGCQQKTCHCVPDSNGTAQIQCSGGCPVIPQTVRPNEACPSPKVIQPKDHCVCPYVVCDNNLNPLDLPDKSVQKGGTNEYCEFKGDRIAIGKDFYDNCRAVCRCEPGGNLSCKPIQCSQNFGPHTIKCLEWDIDVNFVPMAPNCCPEPKCKNDGSCSFAGIRFGNFKNIPQELLPCSKRCMCENGQIKCENLCHEVSDQPPLGLPCPPDRAFRGHLPGDKCCLHWQCRDIYQDRIKGSCVYQTKRYLLGEQWDENQTGIKRRCECKNTNGILHVACNPGNCQPFTDRYLKPTPDCNTPTVVVPNDPIMCPYVVCNQTKAEGGELESVDIVAINATSARIRFTIPNLYVGLLGHAEVHYTTDLNAARNQWNIQKFARPKRMFDIPNIEYHLGNLKPDTFYYLQIEVIIEALKSGPTSEIHKLYQPPLPVITSTTTTTTTSTLPPIIMLDMHLTATAIDSTSVKVTWRSFSTQEKKFIDGIQIRYKKADPDTEDWSLSPVLHRNTKQYTLDKLDSATSYAIDLIFIPVESINTNIVSTKPVVVDVPALPKSDYHFVVHIFPHDVAINDGQVDIEVHDLPQPISKYVHMAKLCYKNMESSELMFDYRPMESTKFSFSHLLPNTRYKVWIEFYLTNGQIISSNSMDIITKYNKDRSLGDNNISALTGGAHLVESKYLLTFMVISVFVFVTGSTFLVVTCMVMRRHSTAAISRACISEAAYDNPTYKTFEPNEKCMDDSLSKSSTIPAK